MATAYARAHAEALAPRCVHARAGTGAGESGKSTVLKQMKILHQGGYNDEERESYREIIWSNCLQSMQVLLRGMSTINPPIAFNDEDAEVWRRARLRRAVPRRRKGVAHAVRHAGEGEKTRSRKRRSSCWH